MVRGERRMELADSRVMVTGGGGFLGRRITHKLQELGATPIVIRSAEYDPGDSHCCPSRFRTATIRWDGSGWTVVDRVVMPA